MLGTLELVSKRMDVLQIQSRDFHHLHIILLAPKRWVRLSRSSVQLNDNDSRMRLATNAKGSEKSKSNESVEENFDETVSGHSGFSNRVSL